MLMRSMLGAVSLRSNVIAKPTPAAMLLRGFSTSEAQTMQVQAPPGVGYHRVHQGHEQPQILFTSKNTYDNNNNIGFPNVRYTSKRVAANHSPRIENNDMSPIPITLTAKRKQIPDAAQPSMRITNTYNSNTDNSNTDFISNVVYASKRVAVNHSPHIENNDISPFTIAPTTATKQTFDTAQPPLRNVTYASRRFAANHSPRIETNDISPISLTPTAPTKQAPDTSQPVLHSTIPDISNNVVYASKRVAANHSAHVENNDISPFTIAPTTATKPTFDTAQPSMRNVVYASRRVAANHFPRIENNDMSPIPLTPTATTKQTYDTAQPSMHSTGQDINVVYASKRVAANHSVHIDNNEMSPIALKLTTTPTTKETPDTSQPAMHSTSPAIDNNVVYASRRVAASHSGHIENNDMSPIPLTPTPTTKQTPDTAQPPMHNVVYASRRITANHSAHIENNDMSPIPLTPTLTTKQMPDTAQPPMHNVVYASKRVGANHSAHIENDEMSPIALTPPPTANETLGTAQSPMHNVVYASRRTNPPPHITNSNMSPMPITQTTKRKKAHDTAQPAMHNSNADSNDNSNSTKYASTRIRTTHLGYNENNEVLATKTTIMRTITVSKKPAVPKFASRRSVALTEEDGINLTILARLKKGELLDEAARSSLLNFAKTKYGCAEFSKILNASNNSFSDSIRRNHIVNAFIHLIKGRVQELASDDNFGPFCVSNLLIYDGKSHSDERIHDALMSELFATKQDFLNCATTQYGQLLIKLILEKGGEKEHKLVTDGMKGSMMQLALHISGRFVLLHASSNCSAEHWKPLCDELLESKEHIMQLAYDKYANLSIRQLLNMKSTNRDQLALIVNAFKGNMVEMAMSESGQHSLIAAFPLYINTSSLADELLDSPDTINMLIRNPNGAHVITHFLQQGTAKEKKAVCDGLQGRMVDLALDECACSVMQRAQDTLCAKLWNPLSAELVSTSESIIRLAHSHDGAFMIKGILKNGSEAPYQDKARIANAFKEYAHTLLEKGDREPIFALRIALTHLPQELCDELKEEIFSLPGSLVSYARHERSSNIIKSIVTADRFTVEQRQIMANAFTCNIKELMLNNFGRQVVSSLIGRFEIDNQDRIALIGELEGGTGFRGNVMKEMLQAEDFKECFSI